MKILKLISVLIVSALGVVYVESLRYDGEACMDLCKSCSGTATYAGGRCRCCFNGDEQGKECFDRIRNEAVKHNLDLDHCESTLDRSPRHSLSAARRLQLNQRTAPPLAKTIDRVAAYFMKGGPRRGGSILESSDCEEKVYTPAECESCPHEMEIQIQPDVPSVSSYDDIYPAHDRHENMEKCYCCKRSSMDMSHSHNYGFQPLPPTPSAYYGTPSVPNYLNPGMINTAVQYPPMFGGSLINHQYPPIHIPQYDPLKYYPSATSMKPVVGPTYMYNPQQTLVQPPYTLPFSQTSSVPIQQSPDMLMNLQLYLAQQNSFLESLNQQLKAYRMGNNYYPPTLIGATNGNNKGSIDLLGSTHQVTNGQNTEKPAPETNTPATEVKNIGERGLRIPNIFGMMKKRELQEKSSLMN